MMNFTPYTIDAGEALRPSVEVSFPTGYHRPVADRPAAPLDAEVLRRCAWDIGERRAAEAHQPAVNHVGLAMVAPYQGFAHWRIRQEWVDGIAQERGGAWHHCRLVLRLYDVSYIIF